MTHVPCPAVGGELSWSFKTEGHDIKFAIDFQSTAAATASGGQSAVVVENYRAPSQHMAVEVVLDVCVCVFFFWGVTFVFFYNLKHRHILTHTHTHTHTCMIVDGLEDGEMMFDGARNFPAVC